MQGDPGELMILEMEANGFSEIEWDENDEDEEQEQETKNNKLSKYFEQFSIKENKVKLTLRLDKDVYDWYKMYGKGYQTRINAALRAVMQVELDKI